MHTEDFNSTTTIPRNVDVMLVQELVLVLMLMQLLLVLVLV